MSAAELIGLTKPPPWIAVSTNNFDMKLSDIPKPNNTITSANATKSTFESITKFPSGVTTPESDTNITQTDKDISQTPTESLEKHIVTNTVPPTTTDYEITTIRFNYVPTTTEDTETTEVPEALTTDSWHPVVPSRTTATTEETVSITTYRPKLQTTTEYIEETTTEMPMTVVELQEHKTTLQPTEFTTELSDEERTTVTFQSTEQTTSQPIEETSTIIVEISTEISSERETKDSQYTTKYSSETTEMPTELPYSEGESVSEENSGSNEVITKDTPRPTPPMTTTVETTTKTKAPKVDTTTTIDYTTQQEIKETTTVKETKVDTTLKEDLVESTTEYLSTKSVNELEDLSSYNGEVTTETSSRVRPTEEAGSGAAVAIAVSTIGVIALILLVGLLVCLFHYLFIVLVQVVRELVLDDVWCLKLDQIK